MEDEGAVVVEEVVDLAEEGVVPAQANMLHSNISIYPKDAYSKRTHLSHLERDDLRVGALAAGDVTRVGADDLGALGVAAVAADALVTEGSLVLGEGYTGDTAAVVLVRERGEGAPAAADVEQVVVGLQVELRYVSVRV